MVYHLIFVMVASFFCICLDAAYLPKLFSVRFIGSFLKISPVVFHTHDIANLRRVKNLQGSPTYRHISSIISNHDFTDEHYVQEIMNYRERHCLLERNSRAGARACQHLLMKILLLEQEFSSSHYMFFHGTCSTNFILLRTLLERLRNPEPDPYFFSLRNKGAIHHLSEVNSAYNHIITLMFSKYAREGKLGRFDNDPQLTNDMISVNTALFEGSDGESSMYPNSSPPSWKAVKECVKTHGLKLPLYLDHMLQESLWSMLVILLPRHIAHLSYMSQSFGIPIGLPQVDLLEGGLTYEKMVNGIGSHKEYKVSDFFRHNTKSTFHQARILLHPDHFEKNISGVKMFMFMIRSDDSIKCMNECFSDLRTAIMSSSKDSP